MNAKSRVACVLLLAATALPASALELGPIEVKSALNQPLVASITLRPDNLAELDGMQVGLASAEDFARAGLQLTATDKTLRFSVVTDNNGQKLVLVTSSQPITDPYLDFLLRVDTRKGKQLREYVVLLNPVIAAPAPAVRQAPVAGAATAPQPAPPQPAAQPAPPAPAATQPSPQAAPQPETSAPQPARRAPQPASQPAPQRAPQRAPQPAPATQPRVLPVRIDVHRGDTLYGIARDATRGTDITINQMMIALKVANPRAFFKDNINNLKAGAILRIPTREAVDRVGVAAATAQVRREIEAWQASRPHPATVVEGSAATAAARSAPQAGARGPSNDHLALVAPGGAGGGEGGHGGVAGGTGHETVAGLQQQLKNAGSTLVSVKQANADLESRLRSLQDIADKSNKLLSMKDATIAELQRKLAAIQSGAPPAGGAAPATSVPLAAAAAPAAARSAGASMRPAGNTATPAPPPAPWYLRPAAWIIAGLVVLGLILLGLFRRRAAHVPPQGRRGPLVDPDDIAPEVGAPGYATALRARLAADPSDMEAHLALCRLYHAQGERERFFAAAEDMRRHVEDPDGDAWREVVAMGTELATTRPAPAASSTEDSVAVHDSDPYGVEALRQPRESHETGSVEPHPAAQAPLPPGPGIEAGPEPGATPPPEPHEYPELPGDEPDAWTVEDATDADASASPSQASAAPEFSDDPVDTKLDLARAYIEIGDAIGARSMLAEVLEEGSQVQKDEARRLLAEVTD